MTQEMNANPSTWNDSTQNPAKSEVRVSTLVGDRLCTKCGYNLTGQAVLREPHYDMLIVRCPECGTVASLQEYPLLGRWANRWAVLLAALWLLVMATLWIGCGAVIFGFSLASAEEAASRYTQFISQRFEEWRIQETEKAQAANQNPPTWSSNVLQGWWDQQDHVAMFRDAGGWRHAVDWSALLIWIPFAIVVTTLGGVWAVVLLGRRWFARLPVLAMIMAVAVFFCAISWFEWQSNQYRWYWGDSLRVIGTPIMMASLMFGAVAFTVGLIIGRPVARWMIRILLPPRLRHSLATLWIADGLAPPSKST